MRLLMTADTVGGVWNYALTLCRQLAEHDVNVLLATMGRRLTTEQAAAVEELRNVQCEESAYKLEWMPEPWDDIAAAGDWLTGLAEDFEPDVVHLNGYAHGRIDFGVPVLMVAHSCVNSWWRACKAEPAPAEWDTYTRTVQRGVAGADLLVAPTRAMLNAARRHYGPTCRTTVIHNAADARRFIPDQKQPVIFTAGRLWDEAKNTAALAAAGLPQGWQLRIAGEGCAPGGSGRSMCVETLGFLDRHALAREMRQAAIYALPCRYEPFGLSILEAAHSGCALVLGDIETQRELWDGAARFVNPNDVDDITATLNELAADSRLRARLANIARERARSYSLQKMTGGYLNAYAQLTRGPNLNLAASAAVEA